jgi:tRNA (guanosine-2'-O-)-methyltransferase
VKTCFEHVKKQYGTIYSTYLDEYSKDLYDLDLTQSVALVFGNERNGLSKETLAYCDGNFVIPQSGIIQSLNISVACAVSLYEAYRQKNSRGHYDQRKVNQEQQDLLFTHWGIKP